MFLSVFSTNVLFVMSFPGKRLIFEHKTKNSENQRIKNAQANIDLETKLCFLYSQACLVSLGICWFLSKNKESHRICGGGFEARTKQIYREN